MPTIKIYVGNVAPSARNSELKELFEKFGKVVECDILNSSQTGFGFVHMTKMSEAKAAIAGLDDFSWKGSRLRVEMSTTRTNKGEPSSRRLAMNSSYRNRSDDRRRDSYNSDRWRSGDSRYENRRNGPGSFVSNSRGGGRRSRSPHSRTARNDRFPSPTQNGRPSDRQKHNSDNEHRNGRPRSNRYNNRDSNSHGRSRDQHQSHYESYRNGHANVPSQQRYDNSCSNRTHLVTTSQRRSKNSRSRSKVNSNSKNKVNNNNDSRSSSVASVASSQSSVSLGSSNKRNHRNHEDHRRHKSSSSKSSSGEGSRLFNENFKRDRERKSKSAKSKRNTEESVTTRHRHRRETRQDSRSQDD